MQLVQGSKFAATLDVLVNNVEIFVGTTEIPKIVKNLGKAHKKNNIPGHMFVSAGRALLYALTERLAKPKVSSHHNIIIGCVRYKLNVRGVKNL